MTLPLGQMSVQGMTLPLGQMSVQGMHILMRFSSTSILLLGQARTQELWSTTELSGHGKRDGERSQGLGVE